MISIILPVYNKIDSIEEFHKRLVEALTALNESYEIIAVDDGSTDGTRQKLIKLSPINAVLLSRHFGENAALDAGFKVAIGDLVITVDVDLQNDPVDISKLVEKLRGGAGAVVGWRRNRRQSLYGRVISRLANWLVALMTGVRLHDFSCTLKGYRREFIDGVQLVGDTFIFMPIFAHDRGAKVTEVEVNFHSNTSTVCSRTMKEIISVFFDLVSVKFILNYLAKPLRFFGTLSLFFFIIAIVDFGAAIILKVLHLKTLSSTPLPVIGVMFVILSVILFMLGFVTEILLRIYYENKDSSPYMIYEVIKNKKRLE